ncbi:MAG: CDP-glycerol glycerophosphotransferase family protein, partial [Nocardioidaceae bacterium]
MQRLRRATRISGTVARILRNRVASRAFALRCAADTRSEAAQIAVFFADGPENLYQLKQWLGQVEELAKTYPVAIIVSRPDTGRRLAEVTSLPLVFAPGSAQLEELVRHGNLEVVLYVNHLDLNFRMLRFADPVHVHLGHGESDKDSSVSNQKKAYDLVLVAGRAAQDRMASRLRGFDVELRSRAVGRPQLDEVYAGAPPWPEDGTIRVFYAPTWEGDRPSMAYGSAATHGVTLVRALVADPRFRVIYRPHPRAGFHSPAYAAADRAIRATLARSGRHLVDRGEYGWQWDFADVCVTDVSSAAYDWLATAKPMLVTVPADPLAVVPESRFLAQVPRLRADEAASVVARIDEILGQSAPEETIAELSEYYFGDTSPGASSRRF